MTYRFVTATKIRPASDTQSPTGSSQREETRAGSPTASALGDRSPIPTPAQFNTVIDGRRHGAAHGRHHFGHRRDSSLTVGSLDRRRCGGMSVADVW